MLSDAGNFICSDDKDDMEHENIFADATDGHARRNALLAQCFSFEMFAPSPAMPLNWCNVVTVFELTVIQFKLMVN